MRYLRPPLVGVLIAVGAAFVAGPVPALGASYVVDTTDDDPSVLKSACEGAAGDCSLRGAITRANAASTPGDVITFDAGVFAPGTIPIDSSLPALTGGGDTIDGTGATVLIDTTRETGSPDILFNCLLVSSADNTVKGLQMTDCAIAISVNLNVSDDNVIGPSNVLYDNNVAIGVLASGASGNSVVGNKIGTTADGSAVHPGGGNTSGINISGINTIVGGTTAADRNIISGNSNGTGIIINSSLPTATIVMGNYIGTSASGLADVGNANGVVIAGGASINTIGGTNPGEGNLISGNDNVNLWLQDGANNTVTGNIVGPDIAGGFAFISNGTGILINPPSANNTIGPGNVISDNGIGVSITLNATGNTVKGNLIGTNLAGTSGVPNSSDGVLIDGAGGASTTNNNIGGTAAGDGNTIAFNGGDGVEVRGASATSNAIRGNSIHSNTGKGIETASGGNLELPPPVITTTGSASGTACANCTVDVYSDSIDEGRLYHGSAVADDNGDGTGDWSFPGAAAGPYVTATATNAAGNTSEFSLPFACPDDDADGVCGAGDNCPNWPNPSQSLPPWPVPAGDPDCDGFSTTDEQQPDPFNLGIGTDPFGPCAQTPVSNDEADDRWPPDFDDNRVINILDVTQILPPTFGMVWTGPGDPSFPYRKDIVPDGVINILDVFKVLPPFFGSGCTG